MMRPTATLLLMFWLTFVGSLVCYAQANTPQNAALNKKACDFITKSDAESILGQPVEARADNLFACLFVEPGFTSKVPKNKQLRFSVWYWASPQANDFAERRKNISDHELATAVVKEVPDFADAAIWTWNPGWGGTLHAFKAGTIQVEVTISGIPEDAALQNAKALAARPLGGTAGTGYVYLRGPKTAAVASAAVPSAAAAEAAAPPRTATNGVVRKSKAYWDAYRSNLIRQVFDGNFGSDLDSSTQFRLIFGSYVDLFSKNCRAYLPAQHEAVTVTQGTEKRDRYGNVVSEQVDQSWTVDVDSRFAPKYREYAESPFSEPGQSLGATLGIMSGRVSPSAYFDPGVDMIKFFETETCQSAAMRQLGENLLRAAEGRSSLQDVSATTAGASAETDTSLPPGRFARFVDGCVAFFRARPDKGGGRNMSDWCECLNERYRHVMTPEEESLYANDFERLFWRGIAGVTHGSNDPAWGRLHPAVGQCAR